MNKIYLNEKAIIEVCLQNDNTEKSNKELATLKDILFYFENGLTFDFNKAYEIKDGLVHFVFDEDTMKLDYMLIKR